MSTLFNRGNKPDGNCSSTVLRDSETLASASAALAEELASRGYNWDCLAELFIDFTPEDVSELLKLVYFEYSRLVILNREEVTSNPNDLLFQLQNLCQVFHGMGVKGTGRLTIREK